MLRGAGDYSTGRTIRTRFSRENPPAAKPQEKAVRGEFALVAHRGRYQEPLWPMWGC